MAFPVKNSAADQVCKYLKDVGSATANEIKDATGLSYQTTARAYQEGFMTRIVGVACNSSYVYSLTPQMRDFYAMGATRYQGAIVPPRQVNMFTEPMTGYGASLTQGLREPIRDMSFMRASSQCLPRK